MVDEIPAGLTREIEHDDPNFPSSRHNRKSSQRSVLLEAAATGNALRFGLAANRRAELRRGTPRVGAELEAS